MITAQKVGGENDINYNDVFCCTWGNIKVQKENIHVDPLPLCSYNSLQYGLLNTAHVTSCTHLGDNWHCIAAFVTVTYHVESPNQ